MLVLFIVRQKSITTISSESDPGSLDYLVHMYKRMCTRKSGYTNTHTHIPHFIHWNYLKATIISGYVI